MAITESNPPVPPFLKYFTLFELIVLVLAGVGTLFLPTFSQPLWPWDVAPFNIAFIGAIYLASVAPIAMVARGGQWDLARLVLRMQLVFTGIALIASLINLGRFHFDRPATWAWFFLYISLPLNAAVHLWLYRGAPPGPEFALPAGWRNYLLGQSVVLGLYGLAQFFVGSGMSPLWPWGLDNFHGEIYSGAFVTTALGGLLMARGATRSGVVALGISQIGIAVFAVGGMALVDASVHRINWGAPGTIGWIVGFAVMAIAGAGMLRLSRDTSAAR